MSLILNVNYRICANEKFAGCHTCGAVAVWEWCADSGVWYRTCWDHLFKYERTRWFWTQ